MAGIFGIESCKAETMDIAWLPTSANSIKISGSLSNLRLYFWRLQVLFYCISIILLTDNWATQIDGRFQCPRHMVSSMIELKVKENYCDMNPHHCHTVSLKKNQIGSLGDLRGSQKVKQLQPSKTLALCVSWVFIHSSQLSRGLFHD